MSRTTLHRRIRIGPRSAGLTMTPREFDAITEWDDRYRYELIRGVLVVSPPAGRAERDPNDDLGYLLRTYKETHPQGRCLDLTLPEETFACASNRRRADRAVWIGLGREPDAENDVPAIVIEFVSPSRRDYRRDYEEKRAEYLGAGVKEYWVIDRSGRFMTAFRNTATGPQETIIRESQTYQTELLPGFVLPLARLLERADVWAKKRRPRPRKRGSQ